MSNLNKNLIYTYKNDIYNVKIELVNGFSITGTIYFRIEFTAKNNQPFFKRVDFFQPKIVFGISKVPECLKAKLYISEENQKGKGKNIYPLLELALTTDEEEIMFSDWYEIIYPNYAKDCEKGNK